MPEAGDIFGKVRIIKKGKFLADDGEELFAHLPFLANAESLGRRRGKRCQRQIAEQENSADDVCDEALEGGVMSHVRYSADLR